MARPALQDRLMRFEPSLRLAVELGIVVCIGLLLARMIWLGLAPQAAVSTYIERPLPTMVSGDAQRLEADLSVLVRQNPFEGAGLASETVDDAPETQLNLRYLGGISAIGDGVSGSANIILPNNQQKRFVEGDEILPGVTLKRVLSDRVILNRNGADEVLRQNNRSGRFSVIGDGSVPGSPSDVAPAPVTTRVADPDVLLRALSFSEARSNGRIIGYRIAPRGDLDAFQALGFEAGDVLIRTNGRDIANVDTAELLESIGAYRQALLEIDRNGITVQVILEFDE